jgi:hypothetical protein
MEYDQYRHVLPFDMLLVTIHVHLDSFFIVTSPISNEDGLSVNKEKARGKQWWALQQPPYCE